MSRDKKVLRKRFCALICVAALSACTASDSPVAGFEEKHPATTLSAPQSLPAASAYDPTEVSRGKYMVELLGCGSCHTDKALIGEPVMARRLAGSEIGIAYSSPLQDRFPGVLFPANLTPDPATGIGNWSADDIVRLLRTGENRYGQHMLPVMPWPSYAKLSDEDAYAIAAYLLSLPAVVHEVPRRVHRGQRSKAPFVHFGVYQRQR